MREYQLPDPRTIDRARRGIEDVRAGLERRGRGNWAVYAVRAVEVRPDEWILYAVTPKTSLPLSKDMAAALALERVYLSGRVPAYLLPADLSATSEGMDPIYALEVQMVVLAREGQGSLRSSDGACLISGVIDAREAGAVRLTIAVRRAPLGWPR